MSTIATIEPSSITAGDSVTWQKTLSDYPASAGWVLSYVLLSTAGKITITGSASGDDHLIDVAAVVSAAWNPGTYTWQSYVTNGSARHTVSSSTIIINRNFSSATGAIDTRSHARRMVELIEAVLEGTASTDQRKVKIGDKEIERHTPKELLSLRDYYRAELVAERGQERISQGKRPGNKVLMRF